MRIALGLRQEIRQLAGIDRLLALDSAFQQFPPARAEVTFEFSDEGEGLRGKDLGELRADPGADHQFVGLDAWITSHLRSRCTRYMEYTRTRHRVNTADGWVSCQKETDEWNIDFWALVALKFQP